MLQLLCCYESTVKTLQGNSIISINNVRDECTTSCDVIDMT